MREPGAAAVAGEDGQPGGQTAAGAVAHDGEPVWVDAELLGVFGQPHQSGVGVLDGGGMRVLGSEAVLDGQHRHATAGDVARHRAVEDRYRADDHAAAVEVEHGRAAAAR